MSAVIPTLAACSQRAGDLGRQPSDYYTKYVFDQVDRHLLAGGKGELSNLPPSDAENRMYDLLWRFFSAPHAYEWSPFGKSRVNPIDLRNGKAFERTDKYYSYLRFGGFTSSSTRYSAMVNHISTDISTLPRAFDAVCGVQQVDAQRKTAMAGLPELGDDEREQVRMRLTENAIAIDMFARSLDYRSESYSYALKRLLVETPDEAARKVDAKLSELAVYLERAQRNGYCN